MRLLTTLAIAIGICAVPQQACAQNEASERDYADIFDGLTLDEGNQAYIKRFDTYAFAHDSAAFIGLDEKYGQPGKPVLVLNSYGGGLNDQQRAVGNNHRGLRHVLGYLSSTRDLNASDIAVIGVSDLTVIPAPVQNDPEVVHEMLEDKDATCKVIRSSRHSTVTKTAIFVHVGNVRAMPPEELIPVMACINWGHYFHFGFSGVKDMDMLSFAGIREKSGTVGLPVERFFPLPRFMMTGKLNGKGRKQVLRELAEAYARGSDN